MTVFVNPHAGGGTAAKRWKMIGPRLRSEYGPFETCQLQSTRELQPAIRAAMRRGECFLVAAGGDGTLQALLQAVLTVPDGAPADIYVGAIGLGSSNDFHKPRSSRIGVIPCALEDPEPRDVGVLRCVSEGVEITRYWLLNSSVGITAEANAFFNAPDALLKRLKSRSTTLAITYAALRTIFVQRDPVVRVHRGPNCVSKVQLTNLAVLKSPHCSGALCYELPFQPQSAMLHVHLSEALTRPKRLYMLARLAARRTRGLAQSESWSTNWLRVDADEPFAVEFDGEVIQTKDAVFTVLPRRVRVCRR